MRKLLLATSAAILALSIVGCDSLPFLGGGGDEQATPEGSPSPTAQTPASPSPSPTPFASPDVPQKLPRASSLTQSSNPEERVSQLEQQKSGQTPISTGPSLDRDPFSDRNISIPTPEETLGDGKLIDGPMVVTQLPSQRVPQIPSLPEIAAPPQLGGPQLPPLPGDRTAPRPGQETTRPGAQRDQGGPGGTRPGDQGGPGGTRPGGQGGQGNTRPGAQRDQGSPGGTRPGAQRDQGGPGGTRPGGQGTGPNGNKKDGQLPQLASGQLPQLPQVPDLSRPSRLGGGRQVGNIPSPPDTGGPRTLGQLPEIPTLQAPSLPDGIGLGPTTIPEIPSIALQPKGVPNLPELPVKEPPPKWIDPNRPPEPLTGGKEPPPPPPPPSTELAKGVKVTGVVEVGNEKQVIIKAPGEATSRYVKVGQRVAGGKVLIKRVDFENGEAIIILEENNIEVRKVVGEEPAVEE